MNDAAGGVKCTVTVWVPAPSPALEAAAANDAVVSSLRMVTVASALPPGFAVTPAGSESVSMATMKVSSPSTSLSMRIFTWRSTTSLPAGMVTVRVAALS